MVEGDLPRRSRHLAGRLLFRLAFPHARLILLLSLLAVGQTILMAASPWLVALAIDRGIPAARRNDYLPLSGVCAGLGLCSIAAAFLSLFWRKRIGEICQSIMFSLRTELSAKLQNMSVRFHERTNSGQLIAQLTTDVEAINALLGVTLTNLFQGMISIAVTSAAMLALDLELAMVTFSALMPSLLLSWWTGKRLRNGFGRRRTALAEITVLVVDTLRGIRAIQAYGSERWNERSFDQILDKSRSSGKDIEVARAIYWPALELIFSLNLIATLIVGGLKVSNGELETGILAAFILYTAQFFGPIASLQNLFTAIQQALVATGKLAETLELQSEVPEPQDPVRLPRVASRDVVFEHVRFAHQMRDPGTMGSSSAVGELNFRLHPGRTVAMIGATGSGKSTIAKLIARFYDPDSGRVLIDGIDLRKVADHDLRQTVTLINQESFLFSGTVAANISICRPEAQLVEIEAAARAIGADTFIRALPEGYNTDVNRHGARLSAGQRQMIAFARAYLADPDVLILDEATSALDFKAEWTVHQALRCLLAGRTALVIAHRLSTLEFVDHVLVISDGRIVDEGTPGELMEKGSIKRADWYGGGSRKARPFR